MHWWIDWGNIQYLFRIFNLFLLKLHLLWFYLLLSPYLLLSKVTYWFILIELNNNIIILIDNVFSIIYVFFVLCWIQIAIYTLVFYNIILLTIKCFCSSIWCYIGHYILGVALCIKPLTQIYFQCKLLINR